MDPLEELFPPFGLRISCGPLSMRSVRERDVPEVSRLIDAGIYDPDNLPFLDRWAEHDDQPVRTLQFYWRMFAEFSPDAWHLVLAVHHEGRLVGVQDLSGRHFREVGVLNTGSWLGREFQGRGIGTLMRQAVCAFGFDHLGAAQMSSGFVEPNPASQRVSEKLGYRPNGSFRTLHPDGDRPRQEAKVVLHPEDFVRPPHPVEVAGVERFREFIGL